MEIVVQQGLSHLKVVNCGTSFAVAGTTDAGEIVLEPNTANQCHIDHRWALDRETTKSDPFLPLYSPPN